MKDFTKKQLINKENLAKIRNETGSYGVYRILSDKNDILYVGKAKIDQLDDSIEKHKGRFLKNTKFQYFITSSKKDMDQLELEEIRKYIPPRNKKRKQYA